MYTLVLIAILNSPLGPFPMVNLIHGYDSHAACLVASKQTFMFNPPEFTKHLKSVLVDLDAKCVLDENLPENAKPGKPSSSSSS